MHEIAIVSGFAAAYKLGAKYPFVDAPECKRLFGLYLALGHFSRMVSFCRQTHASHKLTEGLQRSTDRVGFFS